MALEENKTIALKANRGEWSEFYAFLRILADKKLPAADKNLETIKDKFFIFRKIIRDETGQENKVFNLNEHDIAILDSNGNILKTIANSEINSKTSRILDKIKNSSKGTFELPEAEELMHSLLCTQIKASNSKKSDIDGVIIDRATDKEELLGFSVKSMLGGASTLLNAGKTTNFVYRIENFDQSLIESVNQIEGKSKIQDRLKFIINSDAKVAFDKVVKVEFETNLRKIDTMFPVFLSQMLLDFFTGKASRITDLVDLLDKNKEFKESYRLSKSDYEFKIKTLLISIALGMVPSKEWSGFIKAHGGYIVVRCDGSVVCYHLYNREEFLLYLYENTKFESASSGRHDYGKIYMEDGNMYFNLNLQIRFLK